MLKTATTGRLLPSALLVPHLLMSLMVRMVSTNLRIFTAAVAFKHFRDVENLNSTVTTLSQMQ
jgi:hypothetical protein